MCNKTLPINTVVDYYNLATDETVKLKVVLNTSNIFCKGCYFYAAQRHCPDKWACGKVARTDNKAIVFKKI